jgi:AcrR family transcriptional regulator
MDFFARSWQHPLIRETLSSEYSRYIDLLADLLQQGIDRGELHPMDTRVTARLLAATLDGLGLQVIVLPDLAAEQVVDRLLAVLLADLKAGAAGDLSPPR